MTPFPTRRRSSQLSLEITSGGPAKLSRTAQLMARDRVVAPALAALLAGLVAAVGGWVVVAAVVVAGWLSGGQGEFRDALAVASQAWLAAHGGGLAVPGSYWTIAPLGLTSITVVLTGQSTAFAARQQIAGCTVEPTTAELWRAVARATSLATAMYTVVVAVIGFWVGSEAQATRALFGALMLSLLAGGWSGVRTLGLRLTEGWPLWWRAVPRAIGYALAVLLSGAVVTTILAVIGHWSRVVEINASLNAGGVGTVVLVLAQLAYAPNVVLWVMSYMLGAGFSFGAETLVSPTNTKLGMLPAIPALGALPSEGAGGAVAYWWLLVGAAAGTVAAVVIVRARPGARFDETALVGGLAGILSGLVVTALAVFSRGSLGSHRLADIGPRLVELLVMATATLGIAGLVSGLVFGLLRLRRKSSGEPVGAGVGEPAAVVSGQSDDDGVGKSADKPAGEPAGDDARAGETA